MPGKLRAAVIALVTATGLGCGIPAYAVPVFETGYDSTPSVTFTSDAAAYRAADEKRLAPVIKASGAKVD